VHAALAAAENSGNDDPSSPSSGRRKLANKFACLVIQSYSTFKSTTYFQLFCTDFDPNVALSAQKKAHVALCRTEFGVHVAPKTMIRESLWQLSEPVDARTAL
jgi:hypothetical protein